MTVHDITMPLRPGMPAYPGDPPFVREVQGTDLPEVSVLRMGSHTGTHVDAAAHMIEGGWRIHEIDPDVLAGPCAVRDAVEAAEIGPALLETMDWTGVARVLFKTRGGPPSSAEAGPARASGLSLEGARFLIERGVRLVGIDRFSVEAGGASDYPVHRALLAAGVVIVERLDLSRVRPRDGYTVFCGPLPVRDGDGAPARVLLVEP